MQYLNNAGEGADGKHNAITSFFMWAWDANADTEFGLGGLVESGEPCKFPTKASETALHACVQDTSAHADCQNRTSYRELPRTACT